MPHTTVIKVHNGCEIIDYSKIHDLQETKEFLDRKLTELECDYVNHVLVFIKETREVSVSQFSVPIQEIPRRQQRGVTFAKSLFRWFTEPVTKNYPWLLEILFHQKLIGLNRTKKQLEDIIRIHSKTQTLTLFLAYMRTRDGVHRFTNFFMNIQVWEPAHIHAQDSLVNTISFIDRNRLEQLPARSSNGLLSAPVIIERIFLGLGQKDLFNGHILPFYQENIDRLVYTSEDDTSQHEYFALLFLNYLKKGKIISGETAKEITTGIGDYLRLKSKPPETSRDRKNRFDLSWR